MRIQELEQRTGIDRTTIRFYEREGLLHPKRSGNGYRDYSESDAEELQRIKLMRELGVTLDQIRGLQDDSLQFHQVMDQHCVILENREQHMNRARSVCKSLRDSGVGYLDLDMGFYQIMLTAPSLPEPDAAGNRGVVPEKQPYTEPVKKEFHPFRRYIARILDMGLLQGLVHLILVFFFRWKSGDAFFSILLDIVVIVLSIPVQSMMLHFFGITPGKWVMGIRVEAYGGGKLTMEEAFRRETYVTAFGYGLFLPLPVLCVLPVGMILYANTLEILPVYSGSAMKLKDFANNFNAYCDVLGYDCQQIHPNSGVYGGSQVEVRETLPNGRQQSYYMNGTFDKSRRIWVFGWMMSALWRWCPLPRPSREWGSQRSRNSRMRWRSSFKKMPARG